MTTVKHPGTPIAGPTTLTNPHVHGTLPGPRSAESAGPAGAAGVQRPHLPADTCRSPSPDAHGSFVRDVDGNVFIDFLAGAGVLSLGPQPSRAGRGGDRAARPASRTGWTSRPPAKDAFTEAQLSMLPAGMRDRMKIHFCGPTGANAVDAAIKLCKTATGRGDVVSFQGGFHGSSHAAMAVTGCVGQKRPIANGMPGVHFFPFSYCGRCPLGLTRETCETNCVGLLERALRDTNGGIAAPAAVILEMVQGEGGVIPARREFVQRVRGADPRAGHPADRRRGADRLRAHRHLVRVRAVRHRARRHRRLEGAVRHGPARGDRSSTTSGSTSGRPARTPAPSAATSWPSPRAPRPIEIIARDDVLGNVRAPRRPDRRRLSRPARRTRGCARSAAWV